MTRDKNAERLARIKANAETKQYAMMFGAMIVLFAIGSWTDMSAQQQLSAVVIFCAVAVAAALAYFMAQGMKSSKVSGGLSEDLLTSRPKKQITIRLDASVYEQLEHLAEEDLRSLNNQIEYMLKKSLQQQNQDAWFEETRDRS